ncbi:MAG TPA: hypothetical protein VK066_30300 [Chloroflexota bacterium]|nr:hypothetical protein [Chloroflexota bacterium]
MRFAMRLDPWWQPVLWLCGVVPRTAHVALEGEAVRVRFGLFRYAFPRASVVAARCVGRARLWTMGVGIHGNLVSRLAINGSLGGVVELRLAPPRTFWVLFIPMRVSRLYLSLEDPDGFLDALGVAVPAGSD